MSGSLCIGVCSNWWELGWFFWLKNNLKNWRKAKKTWPSFIQGGKRLDNQGHGLVLFKGAKLLSKKENSLVLLKGGKGLDNNTWKTLLRKFEKPFFWG